MAERQHRTETLTVDTNRGVMIKAHPTGARVCQYVDAPGEYFDASGKPVPDNMARECGYQIETDRAKARRTELRAAAIERAQAVFASADQPRLLLHRGLYAVRAHGLGQFSVEYKGEPITALRLSEQEAFSLFRELSGSREQHSRLNEHDEAE